MKSITLRINDEDFEWLSEEHWKARTSRSAFAASLLSEAIEEARACDEETSAE